MEELEQRLDSQTNEIIGRIKGKLGEERIQSILDMIGENNLTDYITEHPEQFNEQELTLIKEILADMIASKVIKKCEEELGFEGEQSKKENSDGEITVSKVEEIIANQELPNINEETKTTGKLLTQTEEKGELELHPRLSL